jgi:hypothetical protein
MRKPLYPLFLLLILVVFSCSDAVKVEENKPRIFPDYDVTLDEIIRSNVGVIRGVDLNSKASIITKSETKLPTEVAPDFLYFEYQVDTNTNYSVSYSLKNDSLDEVEVQINCKDLELCSRLFAQLKTFYEKKLPNPVEDKGYVVYNCFEGQRKPFVVSLTDNSSPIQGMINLVIYKDK